MQQFKVVLKSILLMFYGTCITNTVDFTDCFSFFAERDLWPNLGKEITINQFLIHFVALLLIITHHSRLKESLKKSRIHECNYYSGG